MLILTIDHTQKVWSEDLTERVVSFLDPSMKNNTASILKSTRVGTIPFKQNHRCACPISYSSAYSGKHINSPLVLTEQGTVCVYRYVSVCNEYTCTFIWGYRENIEIHRPNVSHVICTELGSD